MTPRTKTGTDITRLRYNRIAPYFDVMEGLLEFTLLNRWRKQTWEKVSGESILEIGVGTGKNFNFYPAGKNITAIDFSEKMLARALEKSRRNAVRVNLSLMDVQNLAFAADSFDCVVCTFVFCSVPDPTLGLREIHRILKPGGQIIMLEHVLSSNRILAAVMQSLNPLVKKIAGANINRRTVETVRRSPLQKTEATPVSADLVKLIIAEK